MPPKKKNAGQGGNTGNQKKRGHAAPRAAASAGGEPARKKAKAAGVENLVNRKVAIQSGFREREGSGPEATVDVTTPSPPGSGDEAVATVWVKLVLLDGRNHAVTGVEVPRKWNVDRFKKHLKWDERSTKGKLEGIEVTDLIVCAPTDDERAVLQQGSGKLTKREDPEAKAFQEDAVLGSLNVGGRAKDPVLVVQTGGPPSLLQGPTEGPSRIIPDIDREIDMSSYDFGDSNRACAITGETLYCEAHHLLPWNQKDRKKTLDLLVEERNWREARHGPRLTLRSDIHLAWHANKLEAVWEPSPPDASVNAADVRFRSIPTRPATPHINILFKNVNIAVGQIMAQNLAHNCKKTAFTGSVINTSDGPASNTCSKSPSEPSNRGRARKLGRNARPAPGSASYHGGGSRKPASAKASTKPSSLGSRMNTRPAGIGEVAPLTEENLIRHVFRLPLQSMLKVVTTSVQPGQKFFFSSPNKELNLFDAGKDEHAGYESLYMPLFSLEEMKIISARLGIERDLAENSFKEFGGVIRPMLIKRQQEKHRMQRSSKLSELINKNGIDGLINLMKALPNDASSASEHSHYLLHVDATSDYEDFALKWPSPFVRTMVIRKLSDRIDDAVCSLVVSGGVVSNPTITGYAYEGLELYRIGHCIRPAIRWAQMTQYKESTLHSALEGLFIFQGRSTPATSRYVAQANMLQELDDVINTIGTDRDVLLMPLEYNCPAIDGILVYRRGGGVVNVALLQVTVRTEHPVAGTQAVTYLADLVNTLNGYNNVVYGLVFVLPHTAYGTFRKPSIPSRVGRLPLYKLQL